MLLRFDWVLMLPKHLTDNFRPLHRDGKSTAFSKMIRTGVVRPVRLHHCDGAEVEVGVAVRAALRELLDDLRGLSNGFPVNTLLVRRNQIGIDADLRQDF